MGIIDQVAELPSIERKWLRTEVHVCRVWGQLDLARPASFLKGHRWGGFGLYSRAAMHHSTCLQRLAGAARLGQSGARLTEGGLRAVVDRTATGVSSPLRGLELDWV